MAAAASTAAGLYGRLNRSSTRGFLAYVAACAACAAVLTCFVISSAEPSAAAPNGVPLLSSRSARVWPDLAFNWRVVVATIVGFLGSAFGTVGGVGGGGIFVPMLNLLVGFDTKSAAALSKCMIMGASASSVWYNLQVSHPTKEAPVIDYKLALLFQPMLMLGITIGVELSVIFPYWLITVLIIILFIGTSSRSFYKGILMWREETRILKQEEQAKSACAANDVVLDPSYEEPLLPQPQPEEKSALETFLFNLRWKNILVLMAVWSSFLVLQVLKKNSKSCSTFYWVINILQVPVAVSVFLWEAVQLCRESRARRMNGNWECVCEASIEWSPTQLIFCSFCGLLGGTVGGLLGSGGGFILGPLLLELGCIPQKKEGLSEWTSHLDSSRHRRGTCKYRGCKCDSNIRDDVLLIPLRGGVLLPAQIPNPFCCLPNLRFHTGWILGAGLGPEACACAQESIADCVHPLVRHLRQCSYHVCCWNPEEHLNDQQPRIHGVPGFLRVTEEHIRLLDISGRIQVNT